MNDHILSSNAKTKKVYLHLTAFGSECRHLSTLIKRQMIICLKLSTFGFEDQPMSLLIVIEFSRDDRIVKKLPGN